MAVYDSNQAFLIKYNLKPTNPIKYPEEREFNKKGYYENIFFKTNPAKVEEVVKECSPEKYKVIKNYRQEIIRPFKKRRFLFKTHKSYDFDPRSLSEPKTRMR